MLQLNSNLPVAGVLAIALLANSGALRADTKVIDQAFTSSASLTLSEPLSLEQAINLALQRNPDLHIARERIAEAEAQIGESLAAFYPQIKARMSYQYTDNPMQAFGMIVAQRRFSFNQNINHPGGVTDFRPEIGAVMSLYRGGQDYHREKVAEISKEISELERSGIRNNLIHGVTDGFYALLVAQENLIIAQRAIDAVQREFKTTETRFKGGTALKSDVLSLQVRLASAQEAEIQAQNAIEMARTVLRNLLDLTPHSPVATNSGAEQALPALPPSFDALLQQSLENRPEITIAQRQVETRQREVKIAQGAHLPRIDAFVNYGLNEQSPEFSLQHDNVSAGVAMEVDLFSGFETQQRIRKAERQLAQAQEAERKIHLQINKEVQSAYLDMQQALQRYNVAQASIASAEEALRLVTEQHRAGTVTVTRYIESEVARDQAQAQTAAARFDILRADAALKRALGEWK
ncbi:MAG: TolC family protein [Gammaproteobacteria bacterium]